ncbi:MAG TPA: sulfotransferase [Kineosporiaceae bacterium]
MDVIGVGFGRTGTTSLHAALQHLGFAPCYQFAEVVANPSHIDHWLAAAQGDHDGIQQALKGYRATTDWPGVAFWRELIVAFPKAKIILTTRDAEEWFESIDQTIFSTLRTGQAPPRTARALADDKKVQKLVETAQILAREVMIPRSLGGSIDDRAQVISSYERHNQEVRREVPPDRLLDFDVTQGWGPLCAFLDRPVPAVPFPHENDRGE